MADPVSLSVVVLAYGREPLLRRCVQAALAALPDDGELIVVDNGSRAVRTLPSHERQRIVGHGENLGFAGGCNLGAAHAAGHTLVFLNSDAIVEEGAVQALAAAAARPGVGLACGGVRLAKRPRRMNTVGNPVHYLGVVWVGGFGELAGDHAEPAGVTSASGAFLAVRREVWDRLGGFPEEYFAYHEDTEVSLRARQLGYEVVFEPRAVAYHHYVFNPGRTKFYLIERNRLMTVLIVYPRRLLLAILPALVLYEIGQAVVALRRGRLREKARAWAAIAKRARWIARRRAETQEANQLSAAEFASLLVAGLDSPLRKKTLPVRALNLWLRFYWRLVLRVVAAPDPPRSGPMS